MSGLHLRRCSASGGSLGSGLSVKQPSSMWSYLGGGKE
jgi:hypothetical protein